MLDGARAGQCLSETPARDIQQGGALRRTTGGDARQPQKQRPASFLNSEFCILNSAFSLSPARCRRA